jgi:hypothetical protein
VHVTVEFRGHLDLVVDDEGGTEQGDPSKHLENTSHITLYQQCHASH